MRFIDRARILVRGGDGGGGVVAWRRESYVPRGGPAGGDGGRGGDVYLQADAQLGTLMDLRYRQQFCADPGRSGGSKAKQGRGAEDLVIRVPVGTGVYFEGRPADPKPYDAGVDAESRPTRSDASNEDEIADAIGLDALDEDGIQRLPARVRGDTPQYTDGDLVGDLTQHGERLLLVRGGLAGRGNMHYRTSTNRAPRACESGGRGEASVLRLELKLLADVGIVGFPNVGKSTFIARVSRARPEIADYPFTTLVPQLGVVSLSDERAMVVADVPGLIEGACEGRGLGHDFLRHLERTRVLLHLLAPDPTPGRNPLSDLDVLERELTRYGDMFRGRPRVVALNKTDTPEGKALLQDTREALRQRQIPLFPVCAHSGEGVPALLEALWRRLGRVDRSPKPS
ncbi:MAG: GTPase ObgE [Nannocystaceae bacterium]